MADRPHDERPSSVYGDPERRRQIYGLLATIWPHLAAAIPRAERWGARWHETSTPFVHFSGGAAVAHVGVLAIPLVVAGEAVEIAGVHAVCTHPAHRGKGYSRALMEEALAYCDQRFATAMLTTEEPALYTRYGFRLIPQQVFAADLTPYTPAPLGMRLSLDDATDLALLDRLLQTRTPVSQVLGVREPGWLFKTDVSLWSEIATHVHYLEELSCVVVYQIVGGTLRIYDLVAAELPPLAEVVARIGQGAERLELFFTPDRLQPEGWRTVPLKSGDNLMVRGPFGAEGTPLILPPLARC